MINFRLIFVRAASEFRVSCRRQQILLLFVLRGKYLPLEITTRIQLSRLSLIINECLLVNNSLQFFYLISKEIFYKIRISRNVCK